MKNDLSNVKIGDILFIQATHSKIYQVKITRITQKMIITHDLESRAIWRFSKKDGREVGKQNSPYHSFHAYIPDENDLIDLKIREIKDRLKIIGNKDINNIIDRKNYKEFEEAITKFEELIKKESYNAKLERKTL